MLDVRTYCRGCQKRIIPEGQPYPRGVKAVRHAGRGLCSVCHKMSDDEIDRIELARMFNRDPAEWMKRAACNKPEVDPNWFHPHEFDHATAARAREVCARCPVTAECFNDAIATRDGDGIRAGMTAVERSRLLKMEAAQR
jgi:WhiB family transcriptional regulator, redox-sensing transcriptional regulator